MRTRHWIAILVSLAGGCSFGGDDDDDTGPLGGALTVSGDVVDFQSGATVTTPVSISVTGISPAPEITARDAEFTITPVPENSIFQILASTADYRPTFSRAIEVKSSDVHDLHVPVVLGSQIDAIASAFGITPTAAKGIVILELVGGDGTPRAGIAAADLTLGATGQGPFFLDPQGNAAVGAQSSSASGLVVWFEVTPGTAQAVAAASANVTLDMAVAPVVGGTITLATAKVIDGAGPTLPTNVSFSTTVFPIFDKRGCVACHSGNGPGRDLGGLTLDGSANLAYRELGERATRVVVAAPETSLLLQKPLKEEPPNHQTATFQNAQDPDYLNILVWIREGAKDN